MHAMLSHWGTKIRACVRARLPYGELTGKYAVLEHFFKL